MEYLAWWYDVGLMVNQPILHTDIEILLLFFMEFSHIFL